MLRGDKLGPSRSQARGRVGRGGHRHHGGLDGSFYVINGHKIFITNASGADIYILFARTGGQGWKA
ncbi:MAG: hypothetical protein ACLTTU_05485 [Bilophila wadsworthia]